MMNLQIQLLIWCGFASFAQSVSDLPRKSVIEGKANPTNDEITAADKANMVSS